MRKFCFAWFLICLLAAFANGQTFKESDAVARGNQAFANENFQQALVEYQKGLDPTGEDQATIRYNIGVCYFRLNQPQRAIKQYERAIKLRRGRYQKAVYALGTALLETGEWQRAKTAFINAVELSKGRDAEAWFDLGLVLIHEREPESAADCFRAVIRLNGSGAAYSHNNLGVLLAKNGDVSGAIREFEIAARELPTENLAFRNLELCLRHRARPATESLAGLRLSNTRRTSPQPGDRTL